MCEVEQIRSILDIKLKNNEPTLIDNILDYLLVECYENECHNKEIEHIDCHECGNDFCEEHILLCDECGDYYCEECGNPGDCPNIYCNECSDLYLQCGYADCEKFSCCTRFTVISFTRHSDYGIHNHDGTIVRCQDCISYAYDNM